MKRSEALKKLGKFLSYQNPYDDREIEVQVLEFIENVLKMKPPYNAKGLSSYDIAMGSNPYRWESENE